MRDRHPGRVTFDGSPAKGAPLIRTLAHVSDLHVGRDASTDEAARRLAAALVGARVDAVLLSGDVTHRGLASELARFEAIFRPLIESGRLVVVPGNHDRMGDDAGRALMRGGRVSVAALHGLHVVRVDSTAPHNRSLVDGHGALSAQDVADVVQGLAVAPAGALPVVMLHHHVLPLPVEDIAERLATLVGLPCADELPLGQDLLGRVLGRCRLVLHGHRHVPAEFHVEVPGVPTLRILNAGSTTQLGRARLIAHAGGQVAWEGWLSTEAVTSRAWRPPVTAPAGALAVA